MLSAGCAIYKRVTEPTAPLRSQDELAFFCFAKNHSLDYVDSGREREAEEGKVTSGQDWL